MQSRNLEKLAAAAFTSMIFAAGYVCGSMGSGVAEAQLGALGAQALKGAAGSGTIGEMGTSLVEMEQHVSGLQKNLDTLKKVKSALGG